MHFRRNPLSLATIALALSLTVQTLAQTTWINAVPGYSSLAPCAETRLSSIVRDMASGCGMSSSYACFCSTSYATMNTIIASAVYSACKNGPDTNSAVSVFADYCRLPPVVTFSPTTSAVAQATATSASPSITASSPTPSSTAPAQPSTFSTSTRSSSESNPTSSISSGDSVSGGQPSASTPVTRSASPSPSCCSNTSRSSGLSSGAKGGIAAGSICGFIIALVIATFTFRWCRRKRQDHRSIDQRDAPDSATEYSHLLEKPNGFRDTYPKTKESIKGEWDCLLELIGVLNNRTGSQESRQFDLTRALIENVLDGLAFGVEALPTGQDHLEVAVALCNTLQVISMRIPNDRPSAHFFAQFYKAVILFTHGRLLQQNDFTRRGSSTTKQLYREALIEFGAAVRLSEDWHVSQMEDVVKYRIRSLNMCACIVTQFADMVPLEAGLVAYSEYRSATNELNGVNQNGTLLQVMLKLDERLLRDENARRAVV